MLYGIYIRLDSAVLGARLNPRSKIYELDKRDGKWEIDRAQWRWLMGEALDGLSLKDVPQNVFMPELKLALPATYNYQREVKNNGKVAFATHESLRGGTKLFFPCVVAMPPEEDGRLPSQDQVADIFNYMGRFLGISPWGREHGYGRFRVLHVEELHALPPT